MQTSKTKVTALTKFLLKISDYYRVSNRQHEIKEIEDSIKKLISLNYLAGYINEAHKAEFKNNKKKALENYYEALYYLKHDEIDDDLQEDEITNLENKIRELGGQVQ